MFTVGDIVDDRYEVVGPLGHGGMAQVFRAWDRRLERHVALKLLRPHLTDTDAERFRREIRTLSRLQHPAIVSIYDLGSGAHVYFTMELVEGGPFTDLGPYSDDFEPAQRFYRAAISVAEALAYVHRLGMVHRDLTPRNILLGEGDQPKVMDFGLVQLTESSIELTRTGSTLGTPQYMAPEQATGESTGAAADLYAFGAVLYRTATGVAPFEADNDQAIMYQHVYHAPKPAQAVNPAIPAALAKLLDRMLAKRPEDRPASATEVATALQALRRSAVLRVARTPHAGAGKRGVYPTGISSLPDLKPIWQVRLSEGPQWPSGVIAADGVLLVGQRDDTLSLVRCADGARLGAWRTQDEITSPPLLLDNQVWITTRDGAVATYAWPSGERTLTSSGVEAVGLTPVGDDLLVARRDRSLERWGRSSKEVRWRTELPTPATTPATLVGGLAAVVCEDGWLHAVDARDGKHRFKVEVGAMVAPPVAHGTWLLLATRAGEIHAFDTDSHEVVWSYDLDGEVWGAPVVAGRMLYVASWAAEVRALALKTGEDVWHRALSQPVTASPILTAGTLFVVSEGGELLMLDALTGVERTRHRVAAGSVQASPLAYEDSIVVAALDGTLTCLRARHPG
jgi:outer membrane protein assembly factor BamB